MSQKPEESKALQIPGLSPAKEEPVSVPPDYLLQRDEPVDFTPTFPVYYFFYGTLTSPAQLKRILDLPKEPQLRKAEVNGFAIAKWGDYPALINGKKEDVMTGSTYLVKSEEEAQKLSHYETNAYEVADCQIYFKDDKDPKAFGGKAFVYAGDAQALLEQRFDRKLWNRQMAGKLGR